MRNHHWSRLVALLLSGLMLLLAFTACSDPTPPSESEGSTSGDTTAAETEDLEALLDAMSIPASELSLYRIIYPQNASEGELQQTLLLQMGIEERFGVSLEIRDDFVRAGTDFVESEYEILVGRCARSQSDEFIKTLRVDDYGYAMVEKKLVIAGATATGTVEAVKSFLANGMPESGDSFFLNSARFMQCGTYEISSVQLCGEALSQYVIVYPKGDDGMKGAAEYLADRVLAELSFALSVRNDSSEPAEHEILIGNTSRDTSSVGGAALGEDEYMIAEVGESVWLTGLSSTLVFRAIDGLLSGFEADASDDSMLTLALPEPLRVTCATSALRAMTFNIRCAEYTQERIDLVFRMIDIYAPDTIGFQEATVYWMGLLKQRLGDRYGYVGVGRNADHSGEASPVFYLKSKFELIDSGTRWMTSTPDVSGSKIPESSLPRVYSYAVLKVIATGQTFVHVNTHLEHTSEEAREIQARYLVEFLERYRTTGVAYIVSGDFNCARGAGSYTTMVNAGLSDSLNIAEKKEPGTTYHGYGTTSKVIDHIFVSGSVTVDFYRACTETFASENGGVAYPSDHNPVIIDYVIR